MSINHSLIPEMEVTPSRKRKRVNIDLETQIQKAENDSIRRSTSTRGVLNPAFSSTPKKDEKSNILRLSFRKKHSKFGTDKENYMEVKSIADLVTQKKEIELRQVQEENPNEVVRNPPKKKKKSDLEQACFENPALNLEAPDNTFNPFEVRRSYMADKTTVSQSCFTNPGLNIKVEDKNINPYEIKRLKESPNNQQNGIENPALEEKIDSPKPSTLTIGVPFKPTVGYRIDFHNIPLEKLTPTKLIAEKLVFSPPNTNRLGSLKKSLAHGLSIISEEEIDIGKELDCYQLELENSINEAKLKKNIGTEISVKEYSDQTDLLRDKENHKSIDNNNISGIEYIDPNLNSISEVDEEGCDAKQINIDGKESNGENDIEEKEELDFEDNSIEDDFDFKAPAPFVRAYRKPENITLKCKTSEEKTESIEKTKEPKNKVTSAFRKSIRKLIHPHEKSVEKQTKDKKFSEPGISNIFETIRHSLRRNKDKSNVKTTEEEEVIENTREISIIDFTERTKVFRSAKSINSEPCEEFTIERKLSLRNSLRKSTKDVKNHVLKSVFKKDIEEYNFK